MRCPKCQYIGFDKADRCRNCGYDFSLLTATVDEPDLPIRNETASDGPLADFVIPSGPEPRRSRAERAREVFDLDRLNMPGPVASRDLPLFQTQSRAGDDAPLVAPRAVPRAPLAVRRATPDPGRLRARPARQPVAEPALELDLEPQPSIASVDEVITDRTDRTEPTETGSDSDVSSLPYPGARSSARVIAGLADAALLLAIDAVVIYFTLQLCALSFDEIRVLPLAPLLGFFALLNGGYFVAFTAAGGQTMGKMLAGIRVVARPGDRVTMPQAALRTAGYLISALPAGAGFLAALFSAGGLALHDRLAGTQVVPVAAPPLED